MGRGGGHSGGHHSSHHSSSHSHHSSHRSSGGGYRSSGGRHYHSSGNYGRSHHSSGGSYYDDDGRRRSGCGSGCGTLFSFLLIFIMVGVFSYIKTGTIPLVDKLGLGIQRSTVAREKLPEDDCDPIDEWYQDDWGDWVPETEEVPLLEGLEYFYEKTGVQPYLWIMGEEGGDYTSEGSLEELGDIRYRELFGDDEGHLLLIFREYPNESGNYIETVTPGYDAATAVMDEEAEEILLDYLDYYYMDESLNEAQFFGAAFKSSADRIMSTQLSVSAIITIIAVALIVIIALIIIAKIVKSRKIAVARQNADKARAEAEAANAAAKKAQTDFDKQKYEDELEKLCVAVACPNCGSNGNKIRKGTVGYCEYCGSAIKVDDYGNVEVTPATPDEPDSYTDGE